MTTKEDKEWPDIEHTLRAMATIYPNSHLWDRLDGLACLKAVYEIERLRNEVKELSEDKRRLDFIEQAVMAKGDLQPGLVILLRGREDHKLTVTVKMTEMPRMELHRSSFPTVRSALTAIMNHDQDQS